MLFGNFGGILRIKILHVCLPFCPQLCAWSCPQQICRLLYLVKNHAQIEFKYSEVINLSVENDPESHKAGIYDPVPGLLKVLLDVSMSFRKNVLLVETISGDRLKNVLEVCTSSGDLLLVEIDSSSESSATTSLLFGVNR